MAAAALGKPGTEYGPCEKECEHTDCAASRRMAEAACIWCETPIGYETPFFNVTPDGERVWSKLAHESCE